MKTKTFKRAQDESSSRELACSGANCDGRHEGDPQQHNTDSYFPDTQTSFIDVGEACFPDSQGRYGSSTGSHIQQIEYGYQLETKPDILDTDVTLAIIPEIEYRISGILIPVMFKETCSRSGTRRRRLQAGGLTPFPPDRLEPNGESMLGARMCAFTR